MESTEELIEKSNKVLARKKYIEENWDSYTDEQRARFSKQFKEWADSTHNFIKEYEVTFNKKW